MNPSQIANLIAENIHDNNGLLFEWTEDDVKKEILHQKLTDVTEIMFPTFLKILKNLYITRGQDMQDDFNKENLTDLVRTAYNHFKKEFAKSAAGRKSMEDYLAGRDRKIEPRLFDR